MVLGGGGLAIKGGGSSSDDDDPADTSSSGSSGSSSSSSSSPDPQQFHREVNLGGDSSNDSSSDPSDELETSGQTLSTTGVGAATSSEDSGESQTVDEVTTDAPKELETSGQTLSTTGLGTAESSEDSGENQTVDQVTTDPGYVEVDDGDGEIKNPMESPYANEDYKDEYDDETWEGGLPQEDEWNGGDPEDASDESYPWADDTPIDETPVYDPDNDGKGEDLIPEPDWDGDGEPGGPAIPQIPEIPDVPSGRVMLLVITAALGSALIVALVALKSYVSFMVPGK